MLTAWFDIGAKLFLGLVGLYFAHSYRRQVRLKLAEKRLNAYAKLWALMEVATPVRERQGGQGQLSPEERKTLHDSLTHWYYSDGNGILLEKEARELYLTAKHNLICADEEVQPQELRKSVKNFSSQRGSLSMRQLSLLRSQMRADLTIFATWYYRGLKQSDKEFLAHCGVDLNRKPWRDSDESAPTLKDI